MKLWYHDGRTFITPIYSSAKEVAEIFRKVSAAAREQMNIHEKDHAIYGTKRYDEKTGDLLEVSVYDPPVLLTEEEFDERTRAHMTEHPHDMILAIHAMI